MNAKLRRKVTERKRKMRRRIDKFEGPWSSPMITPPAISYELADKQQAITAGGIGEMLQLTKQLDLRGEINGAIKLFKMLPKGGHVPADAVRALSC